MKTRPFIPGRYFSSAERKPATPAARRVDVCHSVPVHTARGRFQSTAPLPLPLFLAALLLGLCGACGSEHEGEQSSEPNPVERRHDQPEPAQGEQPVAEPSSTSAPASADAATEATGSANPSPLFEWADLGKPVMEGPAPVDPYLAPLIYFESDAADSSTSSASAEELPLAGLQLDGNGAVALAVEPVVYVHDAQVELQGSEYRQLTFLWLTSSSEASQPIPQALRITLRGNGYPGIYELLNQGAGQNQVWVVEALESLAAAQFGAPVNGKSHAIEAAQAAAIVGILPDGPAPMGPYIYSYRDRPALRAIHCRCTPTLAGNIRRPFEYELRSIDQLDGLISTSQTAVAWLWAQFGSGEDLADSLRLPANF